MPMTQTQPGPRVAMATVLQLVDNIFFFMVYCYDDWVYTPLQKILTPVVARMPRRLCMKGNMYDVFTANSVTYTRTALIVPIAVSLKYGHVWVAFWLVVLHDFLDHLDGIVAKVQRALYGPVDDPLLGGFLDAFCDKIVSVFSLWSLYLVIDPATLSFMQYILFVLACSVIIGYEGVLGVVRIQDFYFAFYNRYYQVDCEPEPTGKQTAAVMEGKLKEKLESMGIAFLCLVPSYVEGASVNMPWALYTGVCCLLLSVRFAHASLMRKIDARRHYWFGSNSALRRNVSISSGMQGRGCRPRGSTNNSKSKGVDHNEDPSDNESSPESTPNQNKTSSALHGRQRWSPDSGVDADCPAGNSDFTTPSSSSDSSDCSPDCESESPPRQLSRSQTSARGRHCSGPVPHLDCRVDKVFTIGCFDLFHWGHKTLLKKMKACGRQVIVGVHDSRSVYRLKNRVPIDSTENRMFNVKKYADLVYAIPATDPTPFIQCMIHLDKGETALYVRGDDMPKFPSRDLVESVMPVRLLPYSKGISSTQLRMELFAQADKRDDVIDASDEVFG